MEDKPRVALEGECTTNIMNPPLQCRSQLKVGEEITEPAPSRSVQAIDEETMRVGYHDKRITHQIFVPFVNGRFLSRVAHPL